MALSDEQRAMLQLLLEGGQGYDDIGSLLGIAPDEVRSRARAALTEMAGADPDAQVGLTDYLLGQADPIGRADAVRHLQNDPEAAAMAERLVSQLRLLAPKAQLPEIPAARGGRRAAPPPPPPSPAPSAEPAAAPTPAAPRGPGFAARVTDFFRNLGGGGKRRTQLIAAGIAGLVLLIAIVVLVAGSGGDDGEKTAEDCPTVDSTQAQQAGLPVIPLESAEDAPEGECAPSGQLTFVASKKQLALQLNAVGLVPTSSDNVYTLWLYRSDDQAFPLGQSPSTDGNLSLNVPVPAQLGAVIAGGAFQSVRVALLTRADAQELVTQAQQQAQQTGVVPFGGTTVLEGALPQPQQAQGGAQAPQGQAPQGGGQAPQGGQGGGAGQ